VHWLSLQEVSRLIGARKISPVELTRHMLERVARVDPSLHSYPTVLSEQALEMATLAERLNMWRTICAPGALAFQQANYPSRADEYFQRAAGVG